MTMSQTLLDFFSILNIEPLRYGEGGILYFPIPPLKYEPERGAITNAFCMMIPFFYAVSTSNPGEKVKMLLVSVLFLFFLEASFVGINIYGWVVGNYPQWSSKGIQVHHIIDYPDKLAGLIRNIVYYLNRLHQVFILGIWIWFTYRFKKDQSNGLVEAIL